MKSMMIVNQILRKINVLMRNLTIVMKQKSGMIKKLMVKSILMFQ